MATATLVPSSPLLESFRQKEAPRDVRMMAASGGLAPSAAEQVELLLLLRVDEDPEVAATAQKTLDGLDRAAVAAFLASPEASDEARRYFQGRGIEAAPGGAPANLAGTPLVDAGEEEAPTPADAREGSLTQRLGSMNIAQRISRAMKGTREERAILIRDPNRIVTSAVLSSPKMTDTEIAGIARMGNVSEDVIRTIAGNRAWLKNYSVALALVKNAKTPVALSMNLLARMTDKDLRMLSTDRNVPDVLRVAARKKIVIDK
jgi:hypothetical protein